MTKKEEAEYYRKNKKRLKFMELATEWSSQCDFRRLEDEKRDDLVWQDCSDLFTKFYKDTCKLFK